MSTATKDTIRLKMPDGRLYEIPVQAIAENRARCYVDEFEGSLNRSLEEDTLPHFAESDYAVIDWAKNNMNWQEVVLFARIVSEPQPVSPAGMQDGWMNGDMHVIRYR